MADVFDYLGGGSHWLRFSVPPLWIDNVFVERLWRAVKHKGVYMWGVENLHELERHLGRWFEDYNRRKPHSTLGNQTPWECYRPKEATPWRAAA